ncbi:MAG: fumarylacetoacetase [Hyphomicrobiales bacterium]|nr:fumarylacetoacetase [Hyphomicrobiales bacterium]
MIDHTHQPDLRSWVASANGHGDFPIQNLPFGIFQPRGETRRGGVAIGDEILDLARLRDSGLLTGDAQMACALAAQPTLNAFLGLGPGPRRALRAQLSDVLKEGATPRHGLLHAMADCRLHLPARIGDYTDFYAGINHAEAVGRLFRPDAPLMPNYKWVPIAYHGRASSIRLSGGDVRRPNGQRLPAGGSEPVFGPCLRLDYELEMGVWIGDGNEQGAPVPVAKAADHIAGYCLLNDWSARDIQAWEYQPLGPFLAKNFHTTISAWIVTPEALAPFRCAPMARAESDPKPLPYLFDAEDQKEGGFDVELEVLLTTAQMREKKIAPHRLSLGSSRDLYWTPAQMVAHHTVGGCNLSPGDIFGTGTISGKSREALGSLLEITGGGKEPLQLPTGETRTFLQDGDEIIFRARGVKAGCASIGFGECRGVVTAAPAA